MIGVEVVAHIEQVEREAIIDQRALALVHVLLDRLGDSRPPALRTLTALSAGLEAPEWDVATALVYLESLSVIHRQPHSCGQVAWQIRQATVGRPRARDYDAGSIFSTAPSSSSVST